MRRYFLLLLLSVLSVAGYAQKNHAPYALTNQERKDYVLSIDQGKMKKPHYMVIYGNKKFGLIFPLKLTNNSNDTLKYINMSCSWGEIYQTDNKNIRIYDGDACEKNIPDVYKVAPHKAISIDVPVLVRKGTIGNRFRVGMHVFKFMGGAGFRAFMEPSNSAEDINANLIWSNEVEVPKF